MESIGLDLHKRESQLAIKADAGTITDRRIVTSRERFTAVLGGRPAAKILLEASTEREWGRATWNRRADRDCCVGAGRVGGGGGGGGGALSRCAWRRAR